MMSIFEFLLSIVIYSSCNYKVHMLWSECVPQQNSYVENLIPKVTCITRWGLGEVIMLGAGVGRETS